MSLLTERKRLNITQKDLAKKTGISQSMIAQMEQGTKTGSAKTMKLLSDFYGVSIDELFFAHNNT